MTLRVGSLLVSRSSRRRARVVGLQGNLCCLEFAPGRTQWRDTLDVLRLYRLV
jgi:hypothetical protein